MNDRFQTSFVVVDVDGSKATSWGERLLSSRPNFRVPLGSKPPFLAAWVLAPALVRPRLPTTSPTVALSTTTARRKRRDVHLPMTPSPQDGHRSGVTLAGHLRARAGTSFPPSLFVCGPPVT